MLLSSCAQQIEGDKTQILLLGTLHFQQFQNSSNPETDFASERRQNEFDEVVEALISFNPDAVFIEREPKMQRKLDSLYDMPIRLVTTEEGGLSEAYQIGFRLARRSKLRRVHGVDYYESVSQNLLVSGDHIDKFHQELHDFRNVGKKITQHFLSGEMTIREFLVALNKPENIAMSHELFYSTPAYVQNGTFARYRGLQDEIDTTQIGAEFISLFYERNLKIYSNILNRQLKTNAKRIVLIVGQVHVAVLQDMIKNNSLYQVIPANTYLDQ